MAIEFQKITDAFLYRTKGLFIPVFDVDAAFSLFAGGEALRQAIYKLLMGKMNGEMILRSGNGHISLTHLFPHKPHGHGKRNLAGQLRIM